MRKWLAPLLALTAPASVVVADTSGTKYYQHTPPVIEIPRQELAVTAPLSPAEEARSLMASIPRNSGERDIEAFVQPDTATPIKVSNRDVNRINCPGVIEDVIWSQEKPLNVTPAKNGNVFVKFLVQRQGTRETFASGPADVHVVCNGKVYTLILHPKPSDSVTIYLGSQKAERIQEVVEEWGALPLEEKVKRLTLAMYREETPDGFQRNPTRGSRRDIRFFEGVTIQGIYEIRAPGLGLNATEYRIVAHHPVTLNERDFLLPAFGHVVGVTIDPLVLTPNDRSARLIVVERAINGE